MSTKMSNTANMNRVGGSGLHSESLSGGLRRQSSLRKILCSKQHLDWFNINFNAAKLITALDSKMEVHLCSVKAINSRQATQKFVLAKSAHTALPQGGLFIPHPSLLFLDLHVNIACQDYQSRFCQKTSFMIAKKFLQPKIIA